MRAGFVLVGLVVVATGCIDFKEGLTCSSDSECLGYLCVDSVCLAPEPSAQPGEKPGEKPGGEGGVGGSGNPVVTVASGQRDATSLRQDGSTLYWLATDGGRLKVRKALKSGTSSADVADLGPLSSVKKPAMVVGGDDIYVAAGRNVFRVGKTGGAPTVLATSSGPDYGEGIGIAGPYLVWLSPGSSGSVWRMPLAGGRPEQVASDQFYVEELVAAGTTVYWKVSDGVIIYDVADGSKAKISGWFSRLRAFGNDVVWLKKSEPASFEPTFVSLTHPGDDGAMTYDLDMLLYAVTSDGAGSLFAVADRLNDRDTTLVGIAVADGSATTVKLANSASLKTEIEADAAAVYLIEHDQILRRARW